MHKIPKFREKFWVNLNSNNNINAKNTDKFYFKHFTSRVHLIISIFFKKNYVTIHYQGKRFQIKMLESQEK